MYRNNTVLWSSKGFETSVDIRLKVYEQLLVIFKILNFDFLIESSFSHFTSFFKQWIVVDLLTLNTFSVPGTDLNPLHTLTHLILL